MTYPHSGGSSQGPWSPTPNPVPGGRHSAGPRATEQPPFGPPSTRQPMPPQYVPYPPTRPAYGPPMQQPYHQQYRPSPGGAPTSSATRGLVCGTMAALAYVVLTSIGTTTLLGEDDGDYTFRFTIPRLIANLAWLLAVVVAVGFVIVAADRSRRGRGGVIVAAGVVVLIELVRRSVYVFGWFGVDVMPHFYWQHGMAIYCTLDGISGTFLLVAWFLGRRRSLLSLIVAPVGGLFVAAVSWLSFNIDALRPTPVLDTAVWATGIVVVLVVFAWLGCALDKLVPIRPTPYEV